MICSLLAESKPDHRFLEKAMDLEYDAETMYDQAFPEVEVASLGDPSKMTKKIIEDDGRETIEQEFTIPAKASITKLMDVPRLPMLQRTKWNMIEAYDNYVRHEIPLPEWYSKAMIYDSYEVVQDPNDGTYKNTWADSPFLTRLDRMILRNIRMTKPGNPLGDCVYAATENEEIENGCIQKLSNYTHMVLHEKIETCTIPASMCIRHQRGFLIAAIPKMLVMTTLDKMVPTCRGMYQK
jgi:hypothetical protein